MDRTIVYPGSIPQDTDILSVNRNTMIALGYLAQAMIGNGTVVDGLVCTPTSPATLVVNVGQGSIFELVTVDNTAYGSLAADTTDPLMKIGINAVGSTSFTLTAPVTSGQSINYLIEATFLEEDANAVVLPYYNSANPSSPYSGPSNTGTAQNTLREQRASLQLKAGASAATGSQTTPAVDSGWVALYVITVNYGQTTITSAGITVATGAPFLTNKLTNMLFNKTGAISTGTTLGIAQAGTTYNVSGTATVVLPTAPSALNLTFGFCAVTACTIDAPSGNIVGGVTNTATLSLAIGDFLFVQSDGTYWKIISASADLSGSPPSSPQWTAGAVSSVSGGTVIGGVLTIPVGQWTAGAVSSVTGATVGGGVLAVPTSQWAAGPVTSVAGNVTVAANVLTVPTHSFTFDVSTPPGTPYTLGVQDKLIITFTGTSVVPLHVASVPGVYRVTMVITANNTNNSDLQWNPNDTTYGGKFTSQGIENSDTGNMQYNQGSAVNSFWFDQYGGPTGSDTTNDIGPSIQEYIVSTYTVAKMIMHHSGIMGGGAVGFSKWNDTTTAWTSLGTIFDQGGSNMSGVVHVERLV